MEDEAERLAAMHPWAGTEADEAVVRWMPQHAVQKHRPIARPPVNASWIDTLVSADLEAIDRELDPQAPRPVFGGLLKAGHTRDRTLMFSTPSRWPVVVDFGLMNLVGDQWEVHLNFDGQSIHDIIKTSPKPAKHLKARKPKTYVAPGRKQGKTWIARLDQSKQARKHNGP